MSVLDQFLPAAPVWPAEFRDHLSASSLAMFARCPEQWRRRYLLNEKQRPGAVLVWGGADHYAHEQNFRQKIESGVDISEADVKLAFAEGFDQRVEENGGLSEVEWGQDRPGDLKDRGVLLVGAYHQQVSPRVQPVAVEAEMTLAVPGVPVRIVGRLDVLTAASVIEGKAASAKKARPEPHWRLQGLVYQLATGLPVEWHVKAKTRTPAVYTPDAEPELRLERSDAQDAVTERRLRLLAQQMVSLVERYGPDQPWPTGAPDYGWACGFCGYRPDCAWWVH